MQQMQQAQHMRGGGGMSELYGAAANEHYVSHEDLNQYFAHQKESQEQNARRQERARKQANLRGGSQYGQQQQVPNQYIQPQQALPPQQASYPPQLQNPYPGDMFNPYDPPPGPGPQGYAQDPNMMMHQQQQQQPIVDQEARYRQYYQAYDHVMGGPGEGAGDDGGNGGGQGSQYPAAMSGQYGDYVDPDTMKRRHRELEYEERVAEEETDVAVTNYKSLLRVAAHFGESLADTLDFHAIETKGISSELDKSIKRGEFDQFAQRMQSSRAVEFMREPLSGTATSLSLLVLKNHLKHRGKRATSGRKPRRRRHRKHRYEQSETESEDEESNARRSRGSKHKSSKRSSRRKDRYETESETEEEEESDSDVCNSHIKARTEKQKRREKALDRIRRRTEASADAQSGVSRVHIPFEQHAAAAAARTPSRRPSRTPSRAPSQSGSSAKTASERAVESSRPSHPFADAPSHQMVPPAPKRTTPSPPVIHNDLPEEDDPPLPEDEHEVEVKCNDAVIKSLTDSTKMMTGMASVLQHGSEMVNTRMEQQDRAEELEALAPDDFDDII